MTGDLRARVLGGAERVRLVFPTSGASIAADRCAADGARRFGRASEGRATAAILTNDQPSVALVLGAIAAGARLVSLPLPGRAVNPDAYTGFLRTALAQTGTTEVIARDDIAALLESAAIPSRPHSSLDARPVGHGTSDGFELVQFTSGSTGTPAPILVDAHVLAANVSAILRRVAPVSGDVTVSWLPLSHDMGLIGMLLSSVAAATPSWSAGGEIVLIEPETFLRRPAVWLEAIDHWGGTFTAAPDFGYRLAVSRGAAERRGLASLRSAIVGGEVVRPATLEAVETAFAPWGLRPTALAPAYGMAEVGLAVSVTGPAERWRAAPQRPARGGSGCGGPARPLAMSGPALDGYAVEVDDETGTLTVITDHVARDGLTGATLADPPGSLATGDTGFVDPDGWLCITGRVDDIVVINGRNVSALTIEQAVAEVAGVRPGRAAVINLSSGEWAVAAESDAGVGSATLGLVRREIRRGVVAAVGAAPDEIALLPPGALPMTSSGKLQRSEVRRRWEDETLNRTP